MRFAAWLVFGVLGLLPTPSLAQDAEPLEILVDGKPERAWVQQIGEPALGPAGRIIRFGPGYPPATLVRGTSPRPSFRRAEGGCLFEVGADGTEVLVGATVGERAMTPDALLALDAAAVKGLRRLRLANWDERLAPVLQKIDPQRCFVSIDLGYRDPVIPPLPAGLRYLELEVSTDQLFDIGPLVDLRELRLLSIDGWMERGIESFAPLRGMQRLRVLEVGVQSPEAATFPELKALRHLSFGFNWATIDLSFAARLPALRTIDLRSTLVKDLTPLAGLEHLVSIDSSSAPIRTLPAKGFPALRTLRILSHHLSPEDVAAFVAAHPDCEVRHDWRALLVEALEGFDGIRLEPIVHGPLPEGDDGTVYVTRDSEEIAAFLATLEIDERRSLGRHKCFGELDIQCLKGDEVVVSLGFAHSFILRGSGVDWPADARLTEPSAAALCAWLERRGVAGPAENRRAELRRQAADERIQGEEDDVLGADAAGELRGKISRARRDEIVRAVADTPGERIRVLLRLRDLGEFGKSEIGSRVDGYLVSEEEPAHIRAALDALFADEATAAVAARFVPELGDEGFDPAWLAAARLGAARILLVITEPDERRDGIRLLEQLGTPEAADALSAVLPTEVEVGRLDDTTLWFVIEAATSLATFGDVRHLVGLRRLAAALEGDEAEWYGRERLRRTIEKRQTELDADSGD